MPYSNYSFGKSERLCSKKLIEELFSDQGVHRISEHPFLFLWKEALIESNFPAQVLIIVSKKNFAKATDRNRIRRQLRELYRLNKHTVYESLDKKQKKAAVALIYNEKLLQDMNILKIQYNKLIEKVVKNIDQSA